jgi:hypothetical protein
MLGARRAFVHAPETCQRLPQLALLVGAILSFAAASSPPIPTGFWDRRPQPTPGRRRRALARCPFPHHSPPPHRLLGPTALRSGAGASHYSTIPNTASPGRLSLRELEMTDVYPWC